MSPVGRDEISILSSSLTRLDLEESMLDVLLVIIRLTISGAPLKISSSKFRIIFCFNGLLSVLISKDKFSLLFSLSIFAWKSLPSSSSSLILMILLLFINFLLLMIFSSITCLFWHYQYQQFRHLYHLNLRW